MATLRCPRCLALLPEKAPRCSVCGADPAQPVADVGSADVALAPQQTPPVAAGEVLTRSPGWWLPGAALLVLAAVALAALIALARLAAQAGLAAEAWPALVGVLVVALLAALVAGERRRRTLGRLDVARAGGPSAGGSSAPTDLGLVHLFADRFAPPASGPDSFRPPLHAQHVDAAEAAWRAVAATLLDLAEQDVIELEPHALPTAGEPVQVIAVRVVRPLPHDDAFAALLLRPLTRRGVGASTTVSELMGQALMADRHPARSLLESAREALAAAGYYRPTGTAGTATGPLPVAWARAALLRPLEPDPRKIEAARPQLDALQARLAAWDARDPSFAPVLRHEVLAAFVRARSRAGVRAGH